jgi:hypothetical protein
MWNPNEHTEDENLQWTWLRAVEWGAWPIFISQPIAPVVLLTFPWWSVIMVTTAANVVWGLFIRYRVVIPTLAFWGAVFVRLKWLACPIAAYLLWRRGDGGQAAVALLWPLLMAIVPRSLPKVRLIQNMFMQSLGLEPAEIDDLPPQAHAEDPQTADSSASLEIGGYKLDTSIQGIVGLEEFSKIEYANFRRQFDGETYYNLPKLAFVSRQWKAALGAVDGRVYKIALYFETERKDTAIDVSTQVMQYLEQRIGPPTTQNEAVYTWDKSDGNVIMQLAKVGASYVVNIFQTSRIVRTLTPVR